MRWSPHLTVATIVEHNGRLLFVEELSDGQEVINQPAGHVEENETLIEAAKRETLEETACEIEINSVLGIYTHHYQEKNITYYRVCFIGKLLKQHKDLSLDKEIIRALWITPKDALKHENKFRSPLVANCIKDFQSGRNFPLDLIKEL